MQDDRRTIQLAYGENEAGFATREPQSTLLAPRIRHMKCAAVPGESSAAVSSAAITNYSWPM
jgi:hypothetical protein